MKYPIDAEKYITAMRLLFGPSSNSERVHRAAIPFVNECYAAGLRGAGGYPLDLRTETQNLANYMGKPLEIIQDNPMLPSLIDWANQAYFQGQQDAKNVSKLDTGKEMICGTLRQDF